MKFIVFGTGIYYQNLKKYINIEDIVCFADNAPDKQGSFMDGKQILAPKEVDFTQCDYVLVLIMRNTTVMEQLNSLGVEKSRIKSYYDLGEFLDIDVEVCTNSGNTALSEWTADGSRQNVLIVSHELTRNGVAVVLMHVAILLKKMGYHVLMTSLIGGGLEEELADYGIDYIPNINICYRSKNFQIAVSKMEFVLLGTIGLSDVARSMQPVGAPIMWWMHESNDKNFMDFPLPDGKNIHYFAGGQRVVDCFNRYYPNRKIEKLLYFLPPEPKYEKQESKELVVAVIGAINFRKAQDIFVKAIEMIPENRKKNVRFDLIGTVVEPCIDLDSVLQKEPRIFYLGEMKQEELKQYFCSIDLLVCPSRDDPMPVVVTQAMQHGVPCVVSDQVGQMEYIKNGENGYIFHSENSEELSRILEHCISCPEDLHVIGEKSRQIYEDYFSEKAMKDNLSDIISRILLQEE